MKAHTKIAVSFAAMCLIAAAPLSAQTATKASGSKYGKLARSAEYEQRAIALHAKPDRAAEAARLHRWSAELRPGNDPKAVESLAMAAHMFSYARMYGEARKTMEIAGERALANGDVQRAAQAFVDATFFAQLGSDRTEVVRLGRKALALSESPLLNQQQRNAITSRVRNVPSLAIQER